MVMLQKLASSSTDAVLSALRTRLSRLENGEDEDELDEDDDFDDEATEVFCLGVSIFIFEICLPVASHSPL